VCGPDDVAAIADAIEAALAKPLDSGVDERTARFAYSALAANVADVIEETSRRRPRQRWTQSMPDTQRQPIDAGLDVLHIAYYFPPVGGAGAQRSLKFVRYLPESGCRSIVVTGKGVTTGRWTPSDMTLNGEVPDGTLMLRVPEAEPKAPSGWRGRLHRWFRLRSGWSRWWTRGILDLSAGVTDADVILASASPYDTFEAAATLSRRLGKPWVAGLRDPWALDEMMIYPTGVHRRLEIANMRRLLGTAAAIIMTTPEAARQVAEAFPELAGRPIVSIPNGYDAADFTDDRAAPRDPTKFRIVHTGYLHTELGLQQQRGGRLRRLLGGATPGVEILTRSHVYLLQAVDRLLERDPALRDRLELHFAGVLSDIDRELADRSTVSVLHGYLSHADSIALMRSADLLFLPMQNLPPGRRSTTVPGKTYEYLATGRPILAAVPPGDARDILQNVGHTVCGPDDVAAIADAIADALIDQDSNAPPRELDWDVVHRFERRETTRQLAVLLRDVVKQS
jgi:glycosyltransferase involved in cell wall biosynthesis